MLTAGAAPHLLEPPINALRLTLHPEGMAPRITNLGQWRAHLLRDLAVQVEATGDDAAPSAATRSCRAIPDRKGEPGAHEVFVPLEIDGLSFLSTRTSFSTALDVTVSELAIESFFPADEHTAQRHSRRVEVTLEQVEPVRPVAPVRRQPAVDLGQRRGSSPYQRRCASTRTRTSPASRSTRRCLETPGWLSPRSSTSSPTRCSRSRSRSRIRRRDGSVRTSKTSTHAAV